MNRNCDLNDEKHLLYILKKEYSLFHSFMSLTNFYVINQIIKKLNVKTLSS